MMRCAALLACVLFVTPCMAMLEQVRWQAVVRHQLTPHNRAQAGYRLQRINRRGGYDMNHTLLLNFRTSVALR
jgi:hypothetical protein